MIKKRNFYFAILIILQIIICCWMGHLKRGFFCDEIYSYGLANSNNYTFLDASSAESYSDNLGWVHEDYFRNYVQVNSNNRFSFQAAIKNQINDVHPPLYYMLLHIVCSIFPNSFSKWTGIGLNLIFLILIDYLLYYIAYYLFRKDSIKAILSIVLWSVSAAGLSNILFIRMYLLLTAEILAYIALHIYIAKQDLHQRFRFRNLLLITINVIIGGLTHYYYYPYVFFFSAPICLLLLYHREVKHFLLYAGSLCIGFVINLIFFPASIDHLFNSYRGTEVVNNLKGRGENVFKEFYFNFINTSILGGTIKLFIIALLIIVIYKMLLFFFDIHIIKCKNESFKIIWKKKDSILFSGQIELDSATGIYALIIVATILFSYIAVVGSQLISNRYIYPIYPFLAIVIISFVFYIFNQLSLQSLTKNVIASFLIFIMCILSIRNYGIDFQYPEYDSFAQQAEKVRGDDCLLFYDSQWQDVYTALPLKFIYDETRYFNTNEITNLQNILAVRKSFDDVVICLPDSFTEDQVQNTMQHILNNTSYKEYELVYHYYTQAYLLK